MRCSISLAAAGFLMSAPALAIPIASQDFEGNTLARGITAGNQLGTAPGTFADNSGLSWTASYLAGPNGSGGPIVGIEGGDLIGVVNSGITDAPNGNGFNNLSGATNATGNWFHVDDVDGTLQLDFETVDASSYENLTFDFDWAVADASFEGNDFFEILINGTSIFRVADNDLETTPASNNFGGPTLDISGFDGSMLDVVVLMSMNSSAEDMGFDNLLISGDLIGTGDPVPLPAAVWLFGGALAAGGAVRRKLKVS